MKFVECFFVVKPENTRKEWLLIAVHENPWPLLSENPLIDPPVHCLAICEGCLLLILVPSGWVTLPC